MTDTVVREPGGQYPASSSRRGPDRWDGRTWAVAIAGNSGVVLAFVLAAWWLDPVRELAALAAERLPIALYALAAVALAWPWLRAVAPRALGRTAGATERQLGRFARLGGPAAAVVSYLIPLFGGWETARSPYMVGGVIPWSDATLYFGGAQRILFGDGVDEYGAGRPIHPAFLAVRLALTGMDLRKALIIGSILLGIACFLAARAVSKDLGPAAGLALFAGIYGFASPAGSSVMTEGLGVTFGALALALLWTAARQRNLALALAGVVLMTVGQSVRTGTLLVLPAVAVWLAYHYRERHRRLNWRVLGMAVIAGMLGVGINVAAVVATSGRLASLHGHSGYFLYGLATGHPAWDPLRPNWTQVYDDFPDASLTGADGGKFVNDEAARAIRERPATFAKTVAKSGVNYLRLNHHASSTPIRSGSLRTAVTVLAMITAGAILLARRRTGAASLATDIALLGAAIASVVPLRDPWRVGMYPAWLFAALTVLAYVGFVVAGTRRIASRAPLSLAVVGAVSCVAFAPLLGADLDSARNFASTVPVMALPFALAVGALTRARFSEPQAEDGVADRELAQPGARRTGPWAPALVGAGMLGAALFGAPVAAAMIHKPEVAERRCPDGTEAHAFVGGVALHVVGDGPGTENRRDELESSVLEQLAPYGWRLGPATVPGTSASQTDAQAPGRAGARTMLSAITVAGDDRVAYVNGDVEAPGRSVLYLCGQDETDGISVAFSRVFWPKPITFAFFTGSPLPD